MKYWPQLIDLSPQKAFLLEDLRAQLAKDLHLPLEAIPHRDLLNWLSDWFNRHLGKLDLSELLYRIDLNPLPSADAEELAGRILEREAQKVIFRAQYAGRL